MKKGLSLTVSATVSHTSKLGHEDVLLQCASTYEAVFPLHSVVLCDTLTPEGTMTGFPLHSPASSSTRCSGCALHGCGPHTTARQRVGEVTAMKHAMELQTFSTLADIETSSNV